MKGRDNMSKKSIKALLGVVLGVVLGVALLHRGATIAGRRKYNDDINDAFNSRISNYKGQIVIRLLWGKRSGMSSGPIMLLGNGVNADDRGRRLVRHEYGHFLEYQQLGFLKYLVGIGIPSLTNNLRKTRPYFNQPWEINADMLAGINRPEHTAEDIELGKLYFEYLKSSSFFSIVGNVWNFTNHDLSAITDDVERDFLESIQKSTKELKN